MSTKFFTNAEENTLINKFENAFSYNPDLECFDALVGYFRASGYFRIRPFLDKVPKIRILVGINVDKLIKYAQMEGLQFFKNEEKTKEEFWDRVQQDIQKCNYDKATEDGILQFIDDVKTKKIEIKAHPDKKIHSKVYILRPEPFNEHTKGWVITGSSNLTDSGLGLNNQYEFNVQLDAHDDVKFATDEFEKLWAESVEILPADVANLKKSTYLNEDVTPFELYIKLLAAYFGNRIDYDPDSIGDLPPNFKKLSYQVDAVNEGFEMLRDHNGFVLADVVGLGKTVIAAMVAKKFLLENGRENTKILVVYPPAVEQNWKSTFRYFKIDKYTKFISNGSLHKILGEDPDYWNKEEYDLVIVDEAHKFRNHTTETFQNLQLICKSPRSTKGLIDGSQKKVILVTATPLNNKPDDIFNQIQLFQDARQSTLPITNLTSFFAPLIDDYKILKRDDKLDVDKLRAIYGKIRKNVVEPITIRRTRSDLENIPEYQRDIEEQGIKFPKVEPPQKIEYVMDNKLNELFSQTVAYLIGDEFNEDEADEKDDNKLTYARYQAIAGLKPEVAKDLYEDAETVSRNLAFIMKTQLIKRLESSFFAFKNSLSRFQLATDRMIEMFDNDRIFIAPDTDVNKLMNKGWTDEEIEIEIERLSEANPKNRIFKRDDFDPAFIELLKRDKRLIDELANSWNNIDYDPKLDVFLDLLSQKFLDKRINVEGKLVIFSESEETVNYLHQQLKAAGRKDALAISSDNRKRLYKTIVSNFDANYDADKQVNDYHIIISTEVLAEGVNLHRSNVVVHYDTPWNSTRLMQRIGRVNRIGTKADTVFNYVFYPSAQGDSQIRLNKTAYMKLQGFHTAFGEDNQVYTDEEILDEVKLFGQAKGGEDERLKYLYYLRRFRKENKSWFNKIQKLPLKSRTGRDAIGIKKPDLQNGTAAFLKTDKKFEFYWVDNNDHPKEISPLRAFEIFEASQDEPACALIENHHEQVTAAMTDFETVEQQLEAARVDPEALGGVAQRAKKFLSDTIKNQQVSEQQRTYFKQMIALIDTGKYANLPGDVDRLQKKAGKKGGPDLVIVLEELDKISRKYDIQQTEVAPTKKVRMEKPILIISESFR